MSESLWDATGDELLRRTASSDPTPGGGSISGVSASLGTALVLMAIDVTLASPRTDEDTAATLREARERGEAILGTLRTAVDADVEVFEALMAAYRMPRDDDAERADRSAAIRVETVVATVAPLDVADAALEAVAFSVAVEPLVKADVRSDVLAGRDLLLGAARAALRTADVNLAGLDGEPALHERRQRAWDAILTAL
ncbi:cyclodeaminase/cyclohydrolase family protein [Agrococcus versicolor]|uniref:cyclodeaminase/cyclohydrolase family protein n=1 Tax=Agrococcus versicolor TaxID=501482 RepID=UPI0031D9C8C1